MKKFVFSLTINSLFIVSLLMLGILYITPSIGGIKNLQASAAPTLAKKILLKHNNEIFVNINSKYDSQFLGSFPTCDNEYCFSNERNRLKQNEQYLKMIFIRYGDIMEIYFDVSNDLNYRIESYVDTAILLRDFVVEAIYE